MSHEYVLWIVLFAYGLHIFEETVLDWRSWAEHTFKLKGVEWHHFFMASMVALVTGVSGAMVGWKLPQFGLILPAIQLINAIFFHIIPSIKQKRYSPGLLTAIVLFLPIASWAFSSAHADGVLTVGNTLMAFVFAILMMLAPFLFKKMKETKA